MGLQPSSTVFAYTRKNVFADKKEKHHEMIGVTEQSI
jgi:hypothetical protein